MCGHQALGIRLRGLTQPPEPRSNEKHLSIKGRALGKENENQTLCNWPMLHCKCQPRSWYPWLLGALWIPRPQSSSLCTHGNKICHFQSPFLYHHPVHDDLWVLEYYSHLCLFAITDSAEIYWDPSRGRGERTRIISTYRQIQCAEFPYLLSTGAITIILLGGKNLLE